MKKPSELLREGAKVHKQGTFALKQFSSSDGEILTCALGAMCVAATGELPKNELLLTESENLAIFGVRDSPEIDTPEWYEFQPKIQKRAKIGIDSAIMFLNDRKLLGYEEIAARLESIGY